MMKFAGNVNLIYGMSFLKLKDLPANLVVLLAFFIPTSTTLTYVPVLGILVFWFFGGHRQDKIRWYFNYPLSMPILFLTFIYLAGIVYTSAEWKYCFSSLRDIFRFCCIPIFAYYLHLSDPAKKEYALKFFIAAMLLTCALGMLKILGSLPIGEKHSGSGIFKSHIKTSYFMAIALFFIFVNFYYQRKHQALNLILISVLLFYMFYLNTGRTGYLILLASFSVFAWYQFRLKGLVILGVIFSVLLAAAYFTSEVFATRINELHSELLFYLQGTTVSSLGARLEFAVNSFMIFLQRPFFGFGTGSFMGIYEATYAGQEMLLTDNPHNEYLKIMVEFGVFGLIALLWFFVRAWQAMLKLPVPTKILALGILFSFIVGCLFNSWINDFTESHFVCLMLAIFVSGDQKTTLKPPCFLHGGKISLNPTRP
tara:strand:- start:48568 stop:49842 length:1275 start_codon:yes stop_codon:yes gene_type:complete